MSISGMKMVPPVYIKLARVCVCMCALVFVFIKVHKVIRTTLSINRLPNNFFFWFLSIVSFRRFFSLRATIEYMREQSKRN